MAKFRGSAPPFEVMQRRGGEANAHLPGWMRGETESAAVHTAEPEILQPADVERPVQPAGPGWFATVITLRLPRSTLLAVGVTVLVLLGISFRVGQVLEQRRQRAYQNQADPLRALRAGTVNPALVPGEMPRARTTGVPAAAPAPSLARAQSVSTEDPREPELNYFRLMQMETRHAGEAQRARVFLKAHGVDAAIIPINNGRFVKLVTLQGFDRISGSDAQAYKRALQRLGRKWKSQHKGTSDWSDLYPEKYIPGKT